MRLTWLLLLCATGCSPYNYSKEVSDFSTGVDKLSTAFTSGYDGLEGDHASTLQVKAADTRAPLTLSPSCGAPYNAKDNSDPCGLVFRGPPPKPTNEEAILAKERADTLVAVKVLKDYAKALAAVTNAADRADYDSAVGKLASSVTSLVAAAGAAMPAAAAAAPLAGAAVNLFGWLVGTALDEQRFETLKTAVNEVNKPLPGSTDANKDQRRPIHIVTDTLGKGLAALRDARQVVLYKEADMQAKGLNGSLSDPAYKQRMSDTQTTLAALNALRKADPKGAAKDLAKAHDELVTAVNDPSRSRASLAKAIGDFVDKVSSVQAAMSALSPASPTPKKGS
jgi:hypothetical protein